MRAPVAPVLCCVVLTALRRYLICVGLGSLITLCVLWVCSLLPIFDVASKLLPRARASRFTVRALQRPWLKRWHWQLRR